MASTTNLQNKVQCDIMISYNYHDLDFVQNIKEKFDQQGWTVWYADPRKDAKLNLSQKGEAILSCKVFVMVMSEHSAADAQFQDELALAYISNSKIFPLGLKNFRVINPLLDGGMRLMLAKINWTFFFKEEFWTTNLPPLLESIKEAIAESVEVADTEETEPGVLQFHGMNINVNFTSDNYDVHEEDNDVNKALTSENTTISTASKGKSSLSYDFWDRNFKDKQEVSWTVFRQKFEHDYKEKIIEKYSEEKVKFFVNLIYKDIFCLNKTMRRHTYDTFCEGNPDADPHRFFKRLMLYAVGYYAMRAVFDMNSTLRLTTIQSLGKFAFPTVVNGLTDMLKDDDPNIRAVATIALAKSGKTRKTTVDKIIGMLDDEDRLVRESACLALGSLKMGGKSELAVADKWRNDPIKSVREAAEIAMKRMGGELAKKLIHVTTVLSSEMDALRTPST